ncbi:hypothetical protein NQZ68_039640 [Dissostichus eleginoides]|nr:hypothetical protein NQZ68_039640 [Dissostichus eleginoides]
MAASFDSDLQVIRGAKLSSKFSDYLVLDLIGQGAFAKVTKCVKSATNETVAVRITKIQTEKEHGILQKLRSFDSDVGNFVRWDTSFLYKDHLCQEFELLDMNLKEFVDTRKTLSLHLKDIRPIVHQVATALKVLKGLGITHTDVRPENIMLVDHVRQPLKVKLIDFGSACDATKAEQVPSMQHTWYMAPEAMLGLLCDEPIDMWSLGCIAVELFLGSPLYPGSCEYDMICKITQTQGEMPGHLLNAGLKTRKFYLNTCPNKWTLMTPHEYGGMSVIDGMFSSLDDLKKVQPKQDSHASKAHAMRDKADLENFVELVKQMLQLDPIQRITPSQVLQHLFVKTSHQMDFCPPQNPISRKDDLGSHTFGQKAFWSKVMGQHNNPKDPITRKDDLGSHTFGQKAFWSKVMGQHNNPKDPIPRKDDLGSHTFGQKYFWSNVMGQHNNPKDPITRKDDLGSHTFGQKAFC